MKPKYRTYRIHQNVWGNWNGYHGRKKVESFGLDYLEAEFWLAKQSNPTLTWAELLRKNKPCFGWVNVYPSDGEYVQLNKTHLLEIVKPDSVYNVKERHDGIYIN